MSDPWLDAWLAKTRAILADLQAIEEEQERVLREGINEIREAIRVDRA